MYRCLISYVDFSFKNRLLISSMFYDDPHLVSPCKSRLSSRGENLLLEEFLQKLEVNTGMYCLLIIGEKSRSNSSISFSFVRVPYCCRRYLIWGNKLSNGLWKRDNYGITSKLISFAFSEFSLKNERGIEYESSFYS